MSLYFDMQMWLWPPNTRLDLVAVIPNLVIPIVVFSDKIDLISFFPFVYLCSILPLFIYFLVKRISLLLSEIKATVREYIYPLPCILAFSLVRSRS